LYQDEKGTEIKTSAEASEEAEPEENRNFYILFLLFLKNRTEERGEKIACSLAVFVCLIYF
jgi:hypothetical protein